MRILLAFASAQNLTCIFEWCSLKQRIVISYPEDRLALLAIRDNVTGRYFEFENMKTMATPFGLDVIESHEGLPTNPSELITYTRGLIGMEGFVVRFHNGHMVKIKAEDYSIKHSAKDGLGQEKNVISILCSNKLDDVLPLLSEEDRDQLLDFEARFLQGVDATVRAVMQTVVDARKRYATKKEFALSDAVTTANLQMKALLFLVWDGNDATSAVVSMIGKNASTATKVESVRHLFGGAKWVWGETIRRISDE